MADNKYTKAINDVKTELNTVIELMKKIDKQIIETANKAKTNLGPAFKVDSPDGLNAILKEQTYLMKLLSQQTEDQTNKIGALNTKKKKLVDLSLQEKITARETLKSLKLQAKANNDLIGAYDRLNAKRTQARNTLRNLISSERASRAEIKKAQREYDKLTIKVNKANKATSNFAKTGLGSLARGFKNLIGAFGIIGGVAAIASFTKGIFTLIKKIESLNFALNTVTESQQEFIRVQAFLVDISKRYGAELISTTERYTKFLAATKQSNLSLADTEQIFESVTKASGVLGLRTDELTGVYLALEQMISKGKITTEELRRQLGERLPGAMGIMAKAVDKLNPKVNVTIAVLDKMLKKGEVISAEVLPTFAEELEKAYGIEAVQTVETLVAAQNKLTTSWIEFVTRFEESEGNISDAFKTMFGWATSFVEVLISANRTMGDIAQDVETGNFIRSLKDETAQLNTEAEIQKKTIEEVASAYEEEYAEGVEIAQEKVDDLNKKIDTQTRLNEALGGSAEGVKQTLEGLNEELVKESGILGEQRGKLEAVNKVLHQNTKETEENLKAKKLLAQEGSIGYLKQEIKRLEDEQKKLAVNTDLWRGYAMAIEQAKENLSDLESEFDISVLSGEKVDTKGLLPTPEEAYASAKKVSDAITKAEEERAQRAKEINEGISDHQESISLNAAHARNERIRKTLELFHTVTAEFSEFFDIDISKFDFIFDELENSVADWADASKEAISAVLDASLMRYEIELQEAQRARDLIINNDLASEKEKRLARQRFEREERDIKTRQAKAERDNALIQVAVDTASAIAKATTYLSNPFTAPAFPGIVAAILGTGLVQASIIAAQPLPKFAEGTDAPLQADTLAWVGDAYRKEAITKDGKLLGISPDKPTLAHLPKGAEVHKDAHKYLSENEINNAVFKMNMASDGNALSEKIIDTALLSEVGKLRAETKKTWTEVKKLASRPVNVKNKVTIEKEYEY